MSTPRLLWIDKMGQPVVTTTANGERNARHWGWTPAQAIPSVVPEAVVEAGARALRIEEMDDVVPPGFAARQWDEGVADREKPMRLARAALTAAFPLLTAAPSATREEVYATALAASHVTITDSPYQKAEWLGIADALLARFNITPKGSDHA